MRCFLLILCFPLLSVAVVGCDAPTGPTDASPAVAHEVAAVDPPVDVVMVWEGDADAERTESALSAGGWSKLAHLEALEQQSSGSAERFAVRLWYKAARPGCEPFADVTPEMREASSLERFVAGARGATKEALFAAAHSLQNDLYLTATPLEYLWMALDVAARSDPPADDQVGRDLRAALEKERKAMPPLQLAALVREQLYEPLPSPRLVDTVLERFAGDRCAAKVGAARFSHGASCERGDRGLMCLGVDPDGSLQDTPVLAVCMCVLADRALDQRLRNGPATEVIDCSRNQLAVDQFFRQLDQALP